MFKKYLIIFVALLFSFIAKAEFNYEGKGKLLYPTGTETPFEFGFAFKKIDYGYSFKAGQQELEVQQLPDKYSIWVSLHQNQNVYVQEFSGHHFDEFEWQLGDHNIALKKKVLNPKRAIGDYVLSIDNIDHFFMGKQGQIDILFDNDGISAIEANGFVKDIGMTQEN